MATETTQSQPRGEPPAGDAAAATAAASAAAAAVPALPPAVTAAAGAVSLAAVLRAVAAFHGALGKRTEGRLRKAVAGRGTDEEVAAAVDEEVRRGAEFAARSRERVRAALSGVPGKDRPEALRRALLAERRYAEARQEAMRARVIAAVDRARLRRISPAGATWHLDPSVRKHTADCVFMAGKTWPWAVLDAVRPPRHGGCPCTLRKPAPGARVERRSVGDVVAAVSALEERLRERIAPGPLTEWELFHEAEWTRDSHGRFAHHIAGLSHFHGDELRLPDGTRVKADLDGSYRVVRSGKIVRGFLSPHDAARDALDRSARAKHPRAVGGMRSFRTFQHFLDAGAPAPEPEPEPEPVRRKLPEPTTEGARAIREAVAGMSPGAGPEEHVRIGSMIREEAERRVMEHIRAWEAELERLDEAVSAAAGPERRAAEKDRRVHRRRDPIGEAHLSVLRELRDFGGTVRLVSRRSDVAELAEDMARYLPAAWLERAGKHRNIALRAAPDGGRGWYTHNYYGGGFLTGLIRCPRNRYQTMLHELGHWVEQSNRDPDVPSQLLELDRQYLERRTTAADGTREDPVPLQKLRPGHGYGRSEESRPDEFTDPYIGKTYGPAGAPRSTEILTMGLEGVFFGRHGIRPMIADAGSEPGFRIALRSSLRAQRHFNIVGSAGDADLHDYILGLLAAVS